MKKHMSGLYQCVCVGGGGGGADKSFYFVNEHCHELIINLFIKGIIECTCLRHICMYTYNTDVKPHNNNWTSDKPCTYTTLYNFRQSPPFHRKGIELHPVVMAQVMLEMYKQSLCEACAILPTWYQ